MMECFACFLLGIIVGIGFMFLIPAVANRWELRKELSIAKRRELFFMKHAIRKD